MEQQQKKKRKKSSFFSPIYGSRIRTLAGAVWYKIYIKKFLQL